MPKEFSRTQRLQELIRRELAQLIQLEMKDPRIGLVSVNAVKLTKDLSYAKVYITVLGEEEKKSEALKNLKHAAGFLRSMLSKRITARTVPELNFVYDISIEQGKKIADLIDKAITEDENKAKKVEE